MIARKRLRSPVGQPAARARVFFLLRAASAEAIALFGLMVGFQGAPILEAAALFALALAAMLGPFPLGRPGRTPSGRRKRRAPEP